MSPKRYIIYDERAMLEGTDVACVLCCARTLREARADVRDMFPRGVIYRYDVVRGKGADELVNEEFVEGPKDWSVPPPTAR